MVIAITSVTKGDILRKTYLPPVTLNGIKNQREQTVSQVETYRHFSKAGSFVTQPQTASACT